ncbi:hypothetical protein RSAG8_05630, partial [Rhizoctonia solani AG-8 WAC10335]
MYIALPTRLALSIPTSLCCVRPSLFSSVSGARCVGTRNQLALVQHCGRRPL